MKIYLKDAENTKEIVLELKKIYPNKLFYLVRYFIVITHFLQNQ